MKNVKIFLVHGFEGHPNGGWRPWLMGELEKKEIYCGSLIMENPNFPKSNEWVKEIQYNCKKFPKDEIILVGHSLGVPAILKFLQENVELSKQLKGCVLVSGLYNDDVEDTRSDVLQSFFGEFDWDSLKNSSKRFVIIHGDNDQVVKYAQAEFMSEKLNAQLICIKNGGHLNESAGFLKLPEVLESILEISK